LEDPRYHDNPQRVKNAKILDAEIGAWTKDFTIAELEKVIAEADIPSSRIYDMSDIAKDEQFLDRGMIQKVQDPRLGEVLHPGVVPMMSGGPAGKVRWAGPEIGAHNRDVFVDILGMDEQEIEELTERGVI